MDNDYNSNDYYQSSGSESTNKYSLNLKNDVPEMGETQNVAQNQYGGSPYGGQNPYGGPAGQNPYGGQSPYGGPAGQNLYGGSPYGGAYYQNAASIRAAMSVPVSNVDVNDVLVKSFFFMFLALLVTGISALFAYNTNFLFADINTVMVKLIVCFVLEIVLVIVATQAMKKNNVTLSAVMFFAYSIVNGLTLSVIFYAYLRSDITRVFFITAAVFGLMAAIGYFAKLDLTKLQNILMIGLAGLLMGSLVNLFLKSSGLDYALTIFGIILFMALTAYDIQKIKKLCTNSGLDPLVIGLYGALELYLDFINLFLRLLRIMGRARR